MTGVARTTATFGSGGGEPYARALQDSALQDSALRDSTHQDSAHQDSARQARGLLRLVTADRLVETTVMDVRRWSCGADATDMSLIEEGSGPLLDIGCGPGRMVAAALTIGYAALGVDVSQAAVDLAQRSGIPALRASVFDALPNEGEWMTVLLVDGNIGIGGDPSALLARCSELLSADGCALVEVHNDAELDRTFDCRVVGDDGTESDVFAWSEIGVTALARRASGAGLQVSESWRRQGRSFVRLTRG